MRCQAFQVAGNGFFDVIQSFLPRGPFGYAARQGGNFRDKRSVLVLLNVDSISHWLAFPDRISDHEERRKRLAWPPLLYLGYTAGGGVIFKLRTRPNPSTGGARGSGFHRVPRRLRQ